MSSYSNRDEVIKVIVFYVTDKYFVLCMLASTILNFSIKFLLTRFLVFKLMILSFGILKDK